MLSIYDPDASIADRIHYLKFYETYDGEPINQKLNQLLTVEKYNIFMEQLIDAILYTRNIHNGRGLRDLTYSYLFTLQQFVPMKAVFILYIMVNNGTKQIGSWRDIRTYCEFLAKHSKKGRDDIFIRPIICLYNHQLENDNKKWNSVISDWVSELPRPDARDFISYAAKWVPRESKGRNWLFDILVSLYNDPEYKTIRDSAKTPEQKSAAERKCKMMYRKMVSNLNKELDTLEIKQCANEWSEIDPAKISMTQLYNGANAFTANVDTEDRAKCASVFDLVYKDKLEQIAQKKYSYNVPVWKLVKHILRLVKEGKTAEVDAMNLHWQSYVEHRFSKEKDYYIAMLDISESMYEKDLYTAIGMSCAIATKSLFGQNVLVFGVKPEWVDLSNCEFDQMIHRIMSSFWSKHAIISDAFHLVLDAVVSADMVQEDVDKLKIQLFTNKEIDYESIFQIWREKYDRPFILSDKNFEKMVL